MVSQGLRSTIFRRAPEILDALYGVEGESLTDLYDEADEWRDALRAYDEMKDGQAFLKLAKAVVVAVAAAMTIPLDDRDANPDLSEKVGEARVAMIRAKAISPDSPT